jgi:hypothetical protein
MTSKKTMVLRLMMVSCLLLAATFAQAQDKFKVRIPPAPALGIQPAAVQGIGSANVTLTGRKLSISGTFEKMASAATTAKVGLGQLPGMRGDLLFDLTVAKTGDGKSGTFEGAYDLTPQQVEAFKKGRFYVQIHSEGAPNGHLLGWLLK